MLQIDHIYEFFNKTLFADFTCYSLPSGLIEWEKFENLNIKNFDVLFNTLDTEYKILFYDQEPVLKKSIERCIEVFSWPFWREKSQTEVKELWQAYHNNQWPEFMKGYQVSLQDHLEDLARPTRCFKTPILAVSEKSQFVDSIDIIKLYYFFHGFAASDWFRGYYSLNYKLEINRRYAFDFVSYNRILVNDRSYRLYFMSKLKELDLLNHGKISFNVTNDSTVDWKYELSDPHTKLSQLAIEHIKKNLRGQDRLVIDRETVPGSSSADIPKGINAFWHIVTETVFYYDKLHLTEKIFKPIVSKQPFMLIAAPGNLAYLRGYGFKTFGHVIDESYDDIVDNDERINKVVEQLSWYCGLSTKQKQEVVRELEPIIEYNFRHFFNEFKHIIAEELITNSQKLFRQLEHDDSNVDYRSIYHVLTH